ncbi:MAG: hypothetical protein EA376_06790 [Phycisphaeraceae bacterium]|nr:MAG: hypothetical protein EA376_06790 [Phycisphaeraceae bacterium]
MKYNRMLSAVTRHASRGIALVALATMLGGCANDLQQRADLLEQENMDLRARADQLESILGDLENRRALSEGELRALRAENERLRLEGQRRPEPARASADDFGFEGLSGVSTSSRAGEIVVDIAGDVLFDSGKAELKADARRTLDSIASTLNSRYGGQQIRIAGHTDSDPIRRSGWRTNQRLGAERALSVQEYLVSKGVNIDRTHIASYGPSKPKGTKRESRRVEIVILGGGAQ